MTLPKSRAEAKAQGSTRYWPNVPCRHGHNAPRYTANGRCCVCNDINRDERKKKAQWVTLGEARVRLAGHIIVVEAPRHMAISIRATEHIKPSPMGILPEESN